MKIPKEYLPIMPYLVIRNGKAFISFMKNVFGASEQLIIPAAENKIQHGELRVSDGVIMFSDAGEHGEERPAGMFIYVEDADKTFKMAVNNGAIVVREPTDQEYGRSAGFRDQFGNQWWVTTPKEI